MQESVHIARGLTNWQNGITRNLLTMFTAFLFALGMSGANANDEISMSSLGKSEQSKVERLLTLEVQRVVNRQARLDGQGKYVTAKVSLDISSDFIIIDLGKSYLPTFYGAPMEDLLRELQVYASESLMGVVTVRGVTFLFEGKDISHYFPELRVPDPATRKKKVSTKGRDWRAQRDPYNGITEDFDSLRERNDDINSRPLFANHIGADIIFHLHANGPR